MTGQPKGNRKVFEKSGGFPVVISSGELSPSVILSFGVMFRVLTQKSTARSQRLFESVYWSRRTAPALLLWSVSGVLFPRSSVAAL